MFIHSPMSRAVIAALAAVASLGCAAIHAQSDFVTTVTTTHPIAYFRLDAATGKSQVGSATWRSVGSVAIAAPGAPVAASLSKFAKLNGSDAYIATTQSGGVGGAASIMAWVNWVELPSNAGRLFYVAGESEVGNDLDVQFETNNSLRFYTASGGYIVFNPPPTSLLNQWHMILVTLDTASHTRRIYWDGNSVASDQGGGQAGKKNAFTIGESIVFTGRFFHGGIQDVALWNRALKPAEVSSIFASSKATASPAEESSSEPSAGPNGPMPTTGPFATTAKVEIEDANGKVQLKREEQIAYMFLSAIEIIEHECQLTVQHVCPMSQLLSGSDSQGGQIEHLKFDPNRTDSNYVYTLAASGMAWEAHANPKKPGLKGFCFMSRSVGTTTVTYSNAGKAGWTDTEVGNRGMEGDSFSTQ